jgi:DNA-binding GntR family transcriptional regulator
MLTLRLRPTPVASNRDHLALVEAIERRDPEEAARIHRQHRIHAGKMLVDLLRGGFAQL